MFDTLTRLGASGVTGPYTINRSLRFNRGESTYLTATLGNSNVDLWTFSIWIKRTEFGEHQSIFSSGSDDVYTHLNFDNADKLKFRNWHNSDKGYLLTTRKFRDPNAWMHIVFIWDSDNGTAGDRQRLYINGVRETAFDSQTNPDADQDSVINGDTLGGSDWGEGKHRIGRFSETTDYASGYYADAHFIDGLAKEPSEFAETDTDTGQYKPKKYDGAYGTNGFHLDFSDNSGVTSSTLGNDSANSHDFTPNNFSVTAGVGNDSLEDTPNNNFPTLSPIDHSTNNTFGEGNLLAKGGDNYAAATFLLPSSGKWYAEFSKFGDGATQAVAITRAHQNTAYNGHLGLADMVQYLSNGEKCNRARGNTSDATAWENDADALIGVAVDMDNGAVYFAHDNTWQNSGNPTSGASKTGAWATDLLTDNHGEHLISVQGYNGSTSYGMYANFGQRPFTYTPPTGYQKLCSENLPEPTIKKPSDHFDILTYTGNGSAQSITGLSFEPELVWTKERNGSDDHALWDAMRGVQKKYVTHSTADSTTVSDGLTSFDSNGFSVGANGVINQSSQNYVAFCWNGGSSAVAEEAGSINASVRANTTAGFSNLSYVGNATAGATVEHGLNAVPQWMIIKRTSDNWILYHNRTSSSPEDDYYEWQSASNLATSGAFMWNNTLPTSSLFTLYSDGAVNASGDTIYWWGWSGVEGFSKFGSYVGNGSADGTMVHTGFKPAFVLTKVTSGHWVLWHNKVEGYNPTRTALLTNANNPEEALDAWAVDFLSNGFKLRGTSVHVNGNGSNFIYMAFAETPFKYATAR